MFRPKAGCGLQALQPPGDVAFKSILLSKWNSTGGTQGEEKNSLFPSQVKETVVSVVQC